jgi:hypothetical protein
MFRWTIWYVPVEFYIMTFSFGLWHFINLKP